MQYSLATPNTPFNSPVSPRAMNTGSLFYLRSPLNSMLVPLSPVFVYTFIPRTAVRMCSPDSSRTGTLQHTCAAVRPRAAACRSECLSKRDIAGSFCVKSCGACRVP